jgi:hypothetical protein
MTKKLLREQKVYEIISKLIFLYQKKYFVLSEYSSDA